MFTVKLEVNGRIIKRVDAVRQSDRAYGENRYAVYDGTQPTSLGGRELLGYIVHTYEDGPEVLAKKLLDYAYPVEVYSAHV